jgi:hypothetical protein
MDPDLLAEIRTALDRGTAVPYLGPGVLSLVDRCPVPSTPEALVTKIVSKGSVPHKLLKSLTATAQFIENFKHRKTLATAMTEAFRPAASPSDLHHFLAASMAPLVVHAWYDDLAGKAFEGRGDWGRIQGLSQSEHFGHWTRGYGPDGKPVEDEAVQEWRTILYEPMGSIAPAANFLVSDTDFVEVLTEIDIQTPIPARIQELRKDRHFLFLGCRFNTQLERIFAHQVSKRSSDRHWAVLPDEPTRNESRFLEEHGIERIAAPLSDFAASLLAHDPTGTAMASV